MNHERPDQLKIRRLLPVPIFGVSHRLMISSFRLCSLYLVSIKGICWKLNIWIHAAEQLGNIQGTLNIWIHAAEQLGNIQGTLNIWIHATEQLGNIKVTFSLLFGLHWKTEILMIDTS